MRPQNVILKTNDSFYQSNVIITNTGAPQGTVLSHVLFSIYTNDCKTSNSLTLIIKYADDTIITGLIAEQDYLSIFNH